MNIAVSNCRRIPIPLAPLPEQHRIVEAIESYFSRLDAARAALERVKATLKRYRVSVIQAAVEGRIVPTEAELARAEGREYEPASVLLKRILAERRMRWEESGKKGAYKEPVKPDTSGLPQLPEGWCWASIDQLVKEGRPICYGVLKAGEHRDDGIPIIRVNDITANDLSLNRLKKCDPAREELFARARLLPGDLVVSKDGTIGRVMVVPDALHGANITQHVLRVSASEHVLNRYLMHALHSHRIQSVMKGETRGVALQGINVEDFRPLAIPLPSQTEQVRISGEVDRLLSVADEEESLVTATLARLARTRQSILKWAFEGRLVDQDPNDEPASVLLERIRAEKAAKAGPTEAHRKPRGRPPTRRSP